MGRLHSNGKGISASAIPYSRTPPAWLKTTPEQVVDQICKLAKKGATPSQIGVVLRDSHGIAQVKVVTGMHTVLSDALLVFGLWMVANMLFLQVTRFSESSSPMVRYNDMNKYLAHHLAKTNDVLDVSFSKMPLLGL
jgi:hypothetical protein